MSPPRPQRRLRAVALLSRRLLVVVVGLWALWGIAVPSWAAPDPADEGVAVESAEEPGCLGDCPEDAEDGECQSGCTACSCCPASAAPAAGTDGRPGPLARTPARWQTGSLCARLGGAVLADDLGTSRLEP